MKRGNSEAAVETQSFARHPRGKARRSTTVESPDVLVDEPVDCDLCVAPPGLAIGPVPRLSTAEAQVDDAAHAIVQRISFSAPADTEAQELRRKWLASGRLEPIRRQCDLVEQRGARSAAVGGVAGQLRRLSLRLNLEWDRCRFLDRWVAGSGWAFGALRPSRAGGFRFWWAGWCAEVWV